MDKADVTFLPPLRLTGATVLRDGVLSERSVALARGRITRGPLPEVDLGGCLVLPGMVDLFRGDGEARWTSLAFSHAAREAAAQGVTTAWVPQDWSWRGGCGSPDAAAEALEAHRTADPTVDLRVFLRIESHATDAADRLVALVGRHAVDRAVFANGLPELVEMSFREPLRFAVHAERSGLSAEGLMDRVRAAHGRAREVPRFLCRMAEAFDTLGVSYGSLGDPDAETRERYSMIGARLAVFPSSRRVAASANAMGDPVILPAGDVAAERMPALDLMREGRCGALASARSGAALLEAVWRLVDRGVLDLPRAWALVSSSPAEVARLPDRGRIEPGKRADLVVIDAGTRRVEATISAGRLVHASEAAARRFAAVLGDGALAAE